MLKDVGFKTKVKATLPVLKQPYTPAAQAVHKGNPHPLPCAAFVWVEGVGKLKLQKELLTLGKHFREEYPWEIKGKM